MIDILYNIFLWLPINDILSLITLNKDSLSILNSKFFWDNKFKLDHLIMIETSNVKWIKQYIKVEKILQEFKNLLQIREVNDHIQIYKIYTNDINEPAMQLICFLYEQVKKTRYNCSLWSDWYDVELTIESTYDDVLKLLVSICYHN